MIALDVLVERFGTPLYIYDLDEIARSVDAMRARLPTPHDLLYSVKANPFPEVLRTLADAGCGAEVSSQGEFDRALAAGFPIEEILLTGPGKGRELLEHMAAAGGRRVSIESPRELCLLSECDVLGSWDVTPLLRVNVPTTSGARLSMSGRASKFGIDYEQLASGSVRLGRFEGRSVGLHFFQGTNIWDGHALETSLLQMIDAATGLSLLGWEISLLDLGGGFPAPYATSAEPEPVDLGPVLSERLDSAFPGWRSGAPRVQFESGRALVASAGRLVCRVLDVKQSGEETFVTVDSGVHHLGGMGALRRVPPVRPRLIAASPRSAGVPAKATIVGPLCTPVDNWGAVDDLASPAPGDLVVVPAVGAYGLTASLALFLGHRAPVEIAVSGDRVVSAMRTSFAYADLDVES